MDNAPTERPQPISSVPDNDLGDVFQRVVHAANVAYYVWIPDTGELQTSSGLQSLFGYDPKTWTPQTFLSAMHPDDVGPYLAALRGHLKSTTNQMDLTWRVRAPDGAYKWARELATLERDRNGRVTRVTSTVTDITQAKQREAELHAALEQQTAIAQVLQIITAAPGNLAPVFEAIMTKALALSECAYGAIFTYDGEGFHTVATRGIPPELASIISEPYVPVQGSDSAFERIARGELAIHIADISATPVYQSGHLQRRAFADLGGARTALWVALRHDDKVLGLISVFRREVCPFSDRQIALLKNFAAQAVIAMDNARLITEQREALEQQTATSEILAVINSSPGDLTPAFDMMLTNAMRLCDATCSGLFTYDGTHFHTAATKGVPAALADHRAHNPPAAHGPRIWPMLQTRTPCHVMDIADTDAYRQGVPDEVAMVELGGARTILNVPLLKRGSFVGFISVYRSEVRAFSDKQIALLGNFAAQAVIAMENARLIAEQREALQRQTATAEILGVINASPGDLMPVFDAVLDKTLTLSESAFGQIAIYDGEVLRTAATRNLPPAFDEYLRRSRRYESGEAVPRDPRIIMHRLVLGEDVVHVADVRDDEAYRTGAPQRVALADLGGARSSLGVALRKDGALLGGILAYRQEVRPYTTEQIAMVKAFAAQAVIAMENARLLGELRERTQALAERNTQFSERIEQQAATIDVLEAMSASPGDPQPVFDLIVERALAFAAADATAVVCVDRNTLHLRAHSGQFQQVSDTYKAVFPRPVARDSAVGRAVLTRGSVIIENMATDREYGLSRTSATIGLQSVVAVPMMRAGTPIGALTMARREPGGFSQPQIELLRTFAEQAVIAITSAENHRALQARTAELARSVAEQREALEHQKASAEILSVIGTSVSDPQPVFDKILESCKLLFGGDELNVLLVDEQGLLQVASYMGKAADVILPTFPAPWQSTPVAPAIRDRRVKHYPDVVNNLDTPRVLRRVGRAVGYHSIAFAPMVWENQGIGAVGVARSRGAFSDRELEIMQGFADQAVIAIQNARMFHEIRHARDTAEAALEDLHHAQDRLVQAEKMASLGQLTAGIAHEIKNPLNFVNNFSELSADLLDELNEVLVPVEQGIEAELRDEIEELTSTLKGNLLKIGEHGRRADSIVKNMLAHSRTGASERRAVDLNATAEEALNLAYHGARAEIPGFNIRLEKQFDPGIGTVELYPQEFTRVLVNLINNGFYAAHKRVEKAPADFEPTLRLSTRNLGEQVEIAVRDNGTGIPANLREKIFEPFFTTKPSGEGTGLGLSLCYDIIVKQHGGQLRVESEPDAFAEFTLTLPRTITIVNQ